MNGLSYEQWPHKHTAWCAFSWFKFFIHNNSATDCVSYKTRLCCFPKHQNWPTMKALLSTEWDISHYMQFYESPNVALWFFAYIMPDKPAGVQQFLSRDKKNLSGDESSLFCSALNMQMITTANLTPWSCLPLPPPPQTHTHPAAINYVVGHKWRSKFTANYGSVP